MKESILYFDEIGLQEVARVGKKNASLGEIFQQLSPRGVSVPDGFATTAKVYRDFLSQNHLETRLSSILSELDVERFSNISEIGKNVRSLLNKGTFPYHTQVQIIAAYYELAERIEMECHVVVRSSAVMKTCTKNCFAGQFESYLNVNGEDALLTACKNCFVSLFTDEAIKVCVKEQIDPMDLALSVGVQQMVRQKTPPTSVEFSLNNEDQQRISQWSTMIDRHFKQSMHIEWMKDSMDGKLYIVQVTPERECQSTTTL